ncbi:hypothetical protein HS088_TW13G00779 [Tripterygium wilfordii]|uniref:Uncharacterized protein n=1 Tax=Tripterygium wilfordii TaxID=458696 RepID=A0A7J7CV61_TRIWF|nr:hypothetical protein HS088_TW13G00779 [Tripterygium wilfordii]
MQLSKRGHNSKNSTWLDTNITDCFKTVWKTPYIMNLALTQAFKDYCFVGVQAYVQLESSRLKLTQLYQELQRARQQVLQLLFWCLIRVLFELLQTFIWSFH